MRFKILTDFSLEDFGDVTRTGAAGGRPFEGNQNFWGVFGGILGTNGSGVIADRLQLIPGGGACNLDAAIRRSTGEHRAVAIQVVHTRQRRSFIVS